MKLFEKAFIRKLTEDNLAGAGGVFGDAESMGHGGAIGNTDFYATNDNRLPSEGGKKKKDEDEKSAAAKNVGINMLLPVQRRPLSKSM